MWRKRWRDRGVGVGESALHYRTAVTPGAIETRDSFHSAAAGPAQRRESLRWRRAVGGGVGERLGDGGWWR